MANDTQKRFKETMSQKDVQRWLNFIKTRSMVFQTVGGLEKDLKNFLLLWNDVNNYDGPKKDGNSWNQSYWTSLVDLDFRYVSLEQKYAKIIKETQK